MDQDNFEQSRLWEYINQTNLSQDNLKDLNGFKSGHVNFKISLWNPQTNGIRYLKTLIYNLCSNISPENWNRLRRIHNRDIGDPITVKFNDELVCLDYLQAVFELEFLINSLPLDHQTILEIGAGYGRTCHTILSNYNVEKYYIVDLENCLGLTKQYLRAVLEDNQFNKIHFILVKDINSLNPINFDLCINIDSFAEMDSKTVMSYLKFIDSHCRYLYVKNPVGKYLDKSLDDHSEGNNLVNLALSTGILRDIIDIHNNRIIEEQHDKFITAYSPANDWKCLANGWALPWSYYWQALYSKNR